MTIFDAFYLILPLFLIIFLGWLLFRLHVATEQWIKVLNEFAFYVGLPLLSFMNLYTLDLQAFGNAVLISNSIFMMIAIGLTVALTFLLRLSRTSGGVVILCALFGNIAYMGYPVNEMVFGKDGLSVAVIVCSISTFFFFTFAIAAAQYRAGSNPNLRHVLLHIAKIPLLWAVVIGAIMGYFRIPLPAVVVKPLNMLAVASSAVVLLALGVFMATLSLRRQIGQIALIAALKLAMLPLMFWLISLAFDMDTLQFSVSMLQASMPVGVSAFTIADNMRLDQEVAASSVFATTLLSVLTLPALVAWLT